MPRGLFHARPGRPWLTRGAAVFDRIKDVLLAANPSHVLGWDTTPFGYLAKTARDAECFATGSVADDAIVEACTVDGAGQRGRTFRLR